MIRVACAGDSITEGNELNDTDTDSYPAQLGALLGSSWAVRNFGRRKSTALIAGDEPYLHRPELGQALAFNPDAVVLMLGTNDTKPVNWPHEAGFTRDYRSIVGQFMQLNPVPRILLCLPPPSFPPGKFTISPALISSQIVPRIRTLAQDLKFPVIDLHTPFTYRPDLLLDSVHPTRAGAALIASIVARELRKQFERG